MIRQTRRLSACTHGPHGSSQARTDGSGAGHRVVIVGGGLAGLAAARALRRAPVEVTVVDRTNHHLFQPLLYQVATGILSEGDIAPPIREVLRSQRNTSAVLGEVEDIDLESRRLKLNTLGLRSEIPYDSLIVATGSRTGRADRGTRPPLAEGKLPPDRSGRGAGSAAGRRPRTPCSVPGAAAAPCQTTP